MARGRGRGHSLNSFSWLRYWTQRIKTLFNGHIVAFYPLTDLSGTSAIDTSGNGYNATYAGTVALNQDGLRGAKAAKFTSGALNVFPSIAKFNKTEGYIGMYVKSLNATWTDPSYMAYFGVDNNNRIMFRNGTSVMEFYYFAGGTNARVYCQKPIGTKWFNLGVRWSKTGNKISMFINGVEFGSFTGLGNWSGDIINHYAELFATINEATGFSCLAWNAFILDYAPSDADIRSSYPTKGIVCFEGDSRSSNKSWLPIALSNETSSNPFAFEGYGFCNPATTGDGTQALLNRQAATNAKIISGKNNILIYWAGVNDGDATPAATTYDKIKTYCLAAKAAGWNKVLLCTEIDCQSRMTWHNTQWPALNALIAADHSFADDIIDLGARTELQDASNATYFNADLIHPIDAGYAIIGAEVKAVLQKYLV